jgi:hypothetical protein
VRRQRRRPALNSSRNPRIDIGSRQQFGVSIYRQSRVRGLAQGHCIVSRAYHIIVVWRVRRVGKSVDAHLTGRMITRILPGADHWSSLTCTFVSLSLSCALAVWFVQYAMKPQRQLQGQPRKIVGFQLDRWKEPEIPSLVWAEV